MAHTTIKVGLLLFCGITHASVIRISSLNELQSRLSRVPYAVVLLIDKNKKDNKNELRNFESMFRSVSTSPTYKYAGLQFMSVDVSRDKLRGALHHYAISKTPSVIAFSGRKQMKGWLEGYAYRDQLEKYIATYLGDTMRSVMQAKDAARQRELENAYMLKNYWNADYYNTSYWQYGYYPYWAFGHPFGPWGGYGW